MVKLLWYRTGLATISAPSIPQVISVLKKDALCYGHQVCQLHSPCRIHLLTLILTLSSPLPQKSWRDLPTVHTLLRLLMSEPRNDSNGSQSVQTLAKNGLPFLRSQTLKVANGCRRMLGKEWGVCTKALRFSSVSPEGPVPHLFVQKKGLGGFTPSCQQWPSFTILEVSLLLFLYLWFYYLIQWTSSDLVAGPKHIFNLKKSSILSRRHITESLS